MLSDALLRANFPAGMFLSPYLRPVATWLKARLRLIVPSFTPVSTRNPGPIRLSSTFSATVCSKRSAVNLKYLLSVTVHSFLLLEQRMRSILPNLKRAAKKTVLLPRLSTEMNCVAASRMFLKRRPPLCGRRPAEFAALTSLRSDLLRMLPRTVLNFSLMPRS